MTRLFVLVLLVVATVVAYPGVGVAAGVILAVSLAAVWAGARRRRSAPTPRVGALREHMSLDRRVALRRAYRDLNSIERGAGLPPTPPPPG